MCGKCIHVRMSGYPEYRIDYDLRYHRFCHRYEETSVISRGTYDVGISVEKCSRFDVDQVLVHIPKSKICWATRFQNWKTETPFSRRKTIWSFVQGFVIGYVEHELGALVVKCRIFDIDLALVHFPNSYIGSFNVEPKQLFLKLYLEVSYESALTITLNVS